MSDVEWAVSRKPFIALDKIGVSTQSNETTGHAVPTSRLHTLRVLQTHYKAMGEHMAGQSLSVKKSILATIKALGPDSHNHVLVPLGVTLGECCLYNIVNERVRKK